MVDYQGLVNAFRDAKANWNGIEHGQQAVSSSGTAEALNGGASLSVPDGAGVVVRADGDNAGNIYVGDSSVTTSNGFALGAAESAVLHVDDVSTVHIDADNDGEGVSWFVEVNA